MLDVGIKETTTTTGTGTVTLSAATGFGRVSQTFGSGDVVGYMLESGNGDREWGLGVVGAGNTMTRAHVSRTWLSGVLAESTTPISLTGMSTLIVTPNVQTGFGGSVFAGPIDGSARWWCPYMSTSDTNTTQVMTANQSVFIPFVVSLVAKSFTAMLVQVTSAAGSSCELAIYESTLNTNGYRPGRRIVSGSISTATTGVKTVSMQFRPRPGALYWIAAKPDGAPAFRGISNNALQNVLGYFEGDTNAGFYVRSSDAGALPADASGMSFSVAGSGNIAQINLRV